MTAAVPDPGTEPARCPIVVTIIPGQSRGPCGFPVDGDSATCKTHADAGCEACREMGPRLTAPGTSGRAWQCECGTTWKASQ